MADEMTNPLQPIRGPFRIKGGGGSVELALLPDGLVVVSVYEGDVRAVTPDPHKLLGEVVVSSLNWAFALSQLRGPEDDPQADPVGCLRARLDEVDQENRRLKDHLRYHGHDGPECNAKQPWEVTDPGPPRSWRSE